MTSLSKRFYIINILFISIFITIICSRLIYEITNYKNINEYLYNNGSIIESNFLIVLTSYVNKFVLKNNKNYYLTKTDHNSLSFIYFLHAYIPFNLWLKLKSKVLCVGRNGSWTYVSKPTRIRNTNCSIVGS